MLGIDTIIELLATRTEDERGGGGVQEKLTSQCHATPSRNASAAFLASVFTFPRSLFSAFVLLLESTNELSVHSIGKRPFCSHTWDRTAVVRRVRRSQDRLSECCALCTLRHVLEHWLQNKYSNHRKVTERERFIAACTRSNRIASRKSAEKEPLQPLCLLFVFP